MSDPTHIARLFHETYERLAPSFGYETRKASAVPWDDVPESNRRLMVAVAAEVQAALSTTPASDRDALDPTPEPLTRRASLTRNPKYGAALWLGERLVARISATVEDSRISPEEPEPRWLRDAMVFVNAVNAALSTTPAPLDALSLFKAAQRAGVTLSGTEAKAIAAALGRSTP